MLKIYYDNLLKNKEIIQKSKEYNLEEMRENYFKVLREIALTEDEFFYPEVRQKYMQLVGALEEVIATVNGILKLEKNEHIFESKLSREEEKTHSTLENNINEACKVLEEYEKLIYAKWSRKWENEDQFVR